MVPTQQVILMLTWVLLLVPEGLVLQTRGDLFWKSSLIEIAFLLPLIPVYIVYVSGPSYTYDSDEASSTTNYIITNTASTGFLASCRCFCNHPLNISDHLPLCISLHVTSPETDRTNTPAPRIHWEEAVSTGVISEFAKCLDDYILPYLNSQLEGIGHLDQEIQFVCDVIHNIP